MRFAALGILVLTGGSCLGQLRGKDDVVGYWYNCNAKQAYGRGDTLRFTAIHAVTMDAMFDSCGTDSTTVNLWRYTPRGELVSTIKYIDKSIIRPMGKKVLYYPCKVVEKDSILEVPMRRFMNRYKIIELAEGRFTLVLSEVTPVLEETLPPEEKE